MRPQERLSLLAPVVDWVGGCALAFAAQGAEVILLARNTDVLNDLAIGSVDDVVAAVTFLASPGAGLITGTSLLIDGGYTAQ